MGRPPAMTAEERKEVIYAAAETLFGERGYEKVTMADIAAAAAMSKRTLYLMFTDKEELLKSLIVSSYIWPEDAFETVGGDAVAELRLRLRVVANHVLSPRHVKLSRLAISESVAIKGLADAFLDMGIEKSRASLVQSIAQIDRDKFVLDLAPEILAGMLFGATCGYNLMNALLTDGQPDFEAIYATIDAVLARMFRP